MAKQKEAQPVEIVVSTYWPTRIIKSIFVKEGGSDSYRNHITLGAADAKYVYQQLHAIYGEVGDDK